MKIKVCLTLLPLLIISIGCSNNDNKILSHTLKAVPYHTINETGALALAETEKVPIHFFNGSKVPYFNVVNYFKKYIDMSKDFDSYVSYSYETKENKIIVTNNEQNETATIDFKNETITYSNYGGFTSVHKTQEFSTNSLILAGEKYFAGDSNYEFFNQKEYTISLPSYNMHMYFDGSQGYLPLYAIPNLFQSSFMLIPFFNGNIFYIMPKFSNTDVYLTYIKQIREDGDEAYLKDKDLLEFNYNLIALTLDNNFGIKERISRVDGRKITFLEGGAYKTLEPYKEKLMSTEDNVSNDALFELFDKELNDGGHSNYASINIFSTRLKDHERVGDRKHTNDTIKKLQEERKKAGYAPEDVIKDHEGVANPEAYYQEIDDVAFITFDAFKGPLVELNAEEINETNYYNDTISLFYYANKKIRENKNIKNVVVDLSCNGGGYINTCLFAASYLSKGSVTYKCGNAIDKSMFEATVHGDVNLNGAFDEGDYLDPSIKTYCIISNGSFSCGNFLPTLLEDNTNTKFIGEQSGGGCCVIASGYNTALGGQLNISSMTTFLRKESTKDNFVTNENGVTPSFYSISSKDNAKEYFNRNEIISKIHNDK